MDGNEEWEKERNCANDFTLVVTVIDEAGLSSGVAIVAFGLSWNLGHLQMLATIADSPALSSPITISIDLPFQT